MSLKTSAQRLINHVGRHIYLLLLVPVFFITYPLLTFPGIPIGNGDLPYIELSLFPDKKLWTWNEYGSYHGMEVLSRYPLIGLFDWLNLPPDITSKFLIIGLFAIASFSFYFSASRLFKAKLDIRDLKFKMAAVVGSFFYAYNVWSFHRVGHWYFWLGYALLPLFFISVIYALRYPKNWKYVVAAVFLWSVASSSPHMAIFFGIVFASISAGLILQYTMKNRKKLFQEARPIVLIMVVYFCVNLYWIYPYLISSQSENFQWSAAVTEETTRELSRESDFLNVVRLLEGTFNMGEIQVVPAQNSALYPAWFLASFVVPVVSFAALIWWKGKLFQYAIIFSIVSVIGILLTMGTNAPFNLYSTLLFVTPVISNLQILFREPDKWGFLVAFGFSFLIVISILNILSKFERLPHKWIISTCFMAFLVICISVYFYPAYMDSTESLYHPVVLPEEFKNLNNGWTYIGADKTFMMPYAPYNTTWGKNKGTLDLYSMVSPVPNMAPSDYNNVEKYHKYLVNSIVGNKTYSVEKMIYPLGTSYITYHNDTLMPRNEELLRKLTSSLDGVKIVKNIGLFKIFNVGRNEKFIEQAKILGHNSIISGGLDRFASLNYVPYFSTVNSSIIFLDQQVKNEINVRPIKGADSVVLPPNEIDFVLSFLEDKYMLKPYKQTNHHEPSKFWSKAGTNDPGNAWFTPYLEDLGIENWDFDYGNGLVITQAMGTKLSMPVYLPETGQYDIFLRYLKNQKGGIIKVYLDDELVQRVNTVDENSNNFVWHGITDDKPAYLKKGKHILTIENVAGFNAVNVLGIMPSTVAARLEYNVYSIVNEMKNILLLETESSFLNDNSDSNSSITIPSSSDNYYLFKHENNGNNNTANRLFGETYTGQMKIPFSKDLMYLQFIAKGNGNHNNTNVTGGNNNGGNDGNTNLNQSYYLVNDFKIYPANSSSSIYVSDFENRQENLPLSAVRQTNPSTYDNLGMLSPETNAHIDRKGDLRVEVKQDNASDWNIVSTDFVPVADIIKSIQYNFSVSAKDVKQLHSKVVYYDSNKKETNWDFIFTGSDGTFTDTVANTLRVPEDAKFLKLQILAANNPTKESAYEIDKLMIIPLNVEVWKKYDGLSLISLEQNKPISGNGSLKVDLKENNDNNTDWSIVSTEFIPVNDKSYYNLSMDVSARDVKQLHSKVVYYDSNKELIRNLNKQEVNQFVFYGKDGTFTKSYKFSPSIPHETKYMQLQILMSPHSPSDSSYLLDNVKIEEIIPEVALFDNNFASFESVNNSLSQMGSEVETESIYNDDRKESYESRQIVDDDDDTNNNNSLENNEKIGAGMKKDTEIDTHYEENNKIYKSNSSLNSLNYALAQTKPIPVRADSIYNYTVSIEGQNLSYLAAVASFRNSSNIIENSTKYGSNASSGSVLSLSPNSQIYTELNILKPANYAIALRASACDSCTFLTMVIEDKDNERPIKTETISLKQDTSENNVYEKNIYRNNTNKYGSEQLRWMHLNDYIWLNEGKYEVRIYSNSTADIDSMIIYSTVRENGTDDIGNKYVASDRTNNDNGTWSQQPLENAFYDEVRQSSSSSRPALSSPPTYADPGAYISEYKKFNPTKHELKIKNATKPFMMSFAESYDPHWVAYAIDNGANKTNILDIRIDNNKDDSKIRSTPLYSIINGFYVNKTGDFTLTIEYEPQKWFVEGSIVSVMTIILCLSFLVVRRRIGDKPN